MSLRGWVGAVLLVAACNTFDEPNEPPPISLPPSAPPGFPGRGSLPAPAGLGSTLDAGVRCRSTGLFGDGDGLSNELELDAGLDPCLADSDFDGCGDAAEHYLGGCDDPRNGVLVPTCFEVQTREEVRFQLPASAPGWNLVQLHVTGVMPSDMLEPVLVKALGAIPADAATVSDSTFIAVQPGATLRFELALRIDVGSVAELTVGTLRLAADGQVLDEGKLLVLPMPACPNP